MKKMKKGNVTLRLSDSIAKEYAAKGYEEVKPKPKPKPKKVTEEKSPE